MFWFFGHVGRGILASWPGIEHIHLAWKAKSYLDHQGSPPFPNPNAYLKGLCDAILMLTWNCLGKW